MEKTPKSSNNDLNSAQPVKGFSVTGIVSKTEVAKIIDKFKIINRIIQANIGNDLVNITSSDLNDFKMIIFNLNKNFNKENMKYILNSTQKIRLGGEKKENSEEEISEHSENIESQIISPETRQAFTKYFLLLITYLIHFSPQIKSKTVNFIEYLVLTLKLIKKLYRDNILQENEILIISKFILTMSLFSTVMTDTIDRRGKNIKSLLLVWLFLSFFTSLFDFNVNDNEGGEANLKGNVINSVIEEILKFFNNIILVNHSNCFILGDSTKFLSLLDLLKSEFITLENRQLLLNLMVKVYGNRFDINVMSSLMKGLREGLVNITNIPNINSQINNDLRILENNIEFLKTSLNYSRENRDTMRNGFIMNDSLKTGISISPIISFPKKGYTLIFSFKWNSENETLNSKMNLISFIQEKEKATLTKEEIKDFNAMSIYIENSKLHIQIKEIWDTEFIVQPNKTYLLTIVQLQPGFFSRGKSKISIDVNNQFSFTSDINGYPSGKMKCIIGHQTIYDETQQKATNLNYFNGLMGTVILFNEIFTSELVSKLNDLQGDYERILYKNYENLNAALSKEKVKAMRYFQLFDKFYIEKQVVMLISSYATLKSSVVSASAKTAFKENYLELHDNKKLSMISRKIEISPTTNTFENKDFLIEFLKFDGLKYLSLCIVYLNQIPNQITKENTDVWEKISSTFINLLELVLLILEACDIETHLSSFEYLFLHMNVFLEQV